MQVSLANTSIELSRENLQRFARILFPPPPATLNKMCQQGFNDALDFLQRNNLISCTKCVAVQSTLPSSSAEMVAARGSASSRLFSNSSKRGRHELMMDSDSGGPDSVHYAYDYDTDGDQVFAENSNNRSGNNIWTNSETYGSDWDASCDNCPDCRFQRQVSYG